MNIIPLWEVSRLLTNFISKWAEHSGSGYLQEYYILILHCFFKSRLFTIVHLLVSLNLKYDLSTNSVTLFSNFQAFRNIYIYIVSNKNFQRYPVSFFSLHPSSFNSLLYFKYLLSKDNSNHIQEKNVHPKSPLYKETKEYTLVFIFVFKVICTSMW